MSAALAVAIGFRRSATRDLTHVGLALAPRRRRGRWLVTSALALVVLAAGIGIGVVLRDRTIAVVVAPPPVTVSPEIQALRQQLEQARLAARLSDARSHELERQIDTLNQRLAQSQDELAFFRKAREAKQH